MTRAAPVRVAVIGLGGIVEAQLLPACVTVDEVDVVALCRRDAVELGRVADKFHVPGRYVDWRQALAHPGLEAVVVATGPALGPEIIEAAIERGLAVFSEKPLALDAATARRLVDRSTARGTVAMVGYMKTFYPAYARLIELLATPAVGPAALVDLRFWYDSRTVADGFHNRTHLYALAVSLAGPARSIHARRRVTDAGYATAVDVEFDSGAIGTLSLSGMYAWRGPSHERVDVISERRHGLHVTEPRALTHYDPETDTTTVSQGDSLSVHWRESEGFAAELRRFGRLVRGAAEPNPIPFALGAVALAFGEGVARSAADGVAISLG